MDLGKIAESFTRFFIPGLGFTFFLVILPILQLFSYEAYKNIFEELNASIILPLALLFGYIVDNVKLYRYNLSYYKYDSIKEKLINDLNEIKGTNIILKNPDDVLTDIWYEDKNLYDKVFQDRAIWVMIHTTSSITLISSIISLLIIIYKVCLSLNYNIFEWFIPMILLLVSWKSAKHGNEEKLLHHKKLIKLIKEKGKIRNDN